ncbi:MAG TPA: MOSC N-terminal beta barrel domain-containing protein [Actinomycetales bacterium]|nr:MOSC N-terminal beta barrel domain-containing protein [Actinomycetales bacterium]
MEPTVGRVRSLQRFPLKSAAGERLDAVAVTPTGLASDRRWALQGPDGEPVTARQAPSLRESAARVSDDGLRVDVPGSPDGLTGADAEGALSLLAGRAVRLVESDGRHHDVAAVHVVSHGAEAAEDAPDGCDPDPRANLVLDLDDGPGGERGWVGRTLAVGGARLRVTRTPKHCLGVYAEVLAPGDVTVGDAVRLVG